MEKIGQFLNDPQVNTAKTGSYWGNGVTWGVKIYVCGVGVFVNGVYYYYY